MNIFRFRSLLNVQEAPWPCDSKILYHCQHQTTKLDGAVDRQSLVNLQIKKQVVRQSISETLLDKQDQARYGIPISQHQHHPARTI